MVCEEGRVPAGVKADPGWALYKVAGPLDFALTGILQSITLPLAEAGIPLFAVSTYDTDYFLVRTKDADRAALVLKKAGHSVRD